LRSVATLGITLALAACAPPARAASLGTKSAHSIGLDFTAGVPQLLSLDLRVTALSHFEFGLGYGMFPVNSPATSIYTFQPTPVDLGTSDRYNLYPTGTNKKIIPADLYNH
jgi:hypothetical protein